MSWAQIAAVVALLLSAPAWGNDAGVAREVGGLPRSAGRARGSSTVGDVGGPFDAGVSGADLRRADLSPDAGAPLPQWAPRLNATVKPAVAHLGDPVQITLKVRHRAGVSVNLPLQLALGKFSELAREESTRKIPPAEKGGFPQLERTFSVKVAAYELGRLTLPPVEVTALGPAGELVTLRTEPLPIEIRSLMRNEPNPKPKDIEPPVQVFQHTWWLFYTLAGLVLVALTIALTLVISRHLKDRRERLRPPPPPIPAYVVALKRLSEIDVELYIAQERHKELYLLLSEIMRQYVGRRWGFDALEMTTAEVSESLERARVQRETHREIIQTFEGWDLVKFAKVRPSADVARRAVGEAEEMVRATSLLAGSSLSPPPFASHGPDAAAGSSSGPGAGGNDGPA